MGVSLSRRIAGAVLAVPPKTSTESLVEAQTAIHTAAQ
jgi:hypothetical protein